MESKVGSVKCRVWSVKCRAQSVECKLWSVQRGVESVESKVWSVISNGSVVFFCHLQWRYPQYNQEEHGHIFTNNKISLYMKGPKMSKGPKLNLRHFFQLAVRELVFEIAAQACSTAKQHQDNQQCTAQTSNCFQSVVPLCQIGNGF